MTYTLPDLPYAYDALEPYIEKKRCICIMISINTYVTNLNSAIEKYPELGENNRRIII